MSASVEGDRSEVLSLLEVRLLVAVRHPVGEGVDVSVEERRDRCVDCQGGLDHAISVDAFAATPTLQTDPKLSWPAIWPAAARKSQSGHCNTRPFTHLTYMFVFSSLKSGRRGHHEKSAFAESCGTQNRRPTCEGVSGQGRKREFASGRWSQNKMVSVAQW